MPCLKLILARKEFTKVGARIQSALARWASKPDARRTSFFREEAMFPFSKIQTWLTLPIVAVALIGVQAAPAQQPISVSGFNADVIIDKDPTARHSQSFNGQEMAWFEAGAVDDNGVPHYDGLPAGQTFPSATGTGVVYALQPAAVNNVLRIARTESGTLTLNTPAPYSVLAVLAAGGNGGGLDDVFVNYDDGTQDAFPATYDASDWCDSAMRGAITGLGRANPIGDYGLNFGGYTTECPYGIYESFIFPNPAKNIVSVTFHNKNAVYECVFAISGQ
jgi:hypothetical protein